MAQDKFCFVENFTVHQEVKMTTVKILEASKKLLEKLKNQHYIY